MGLGQKLGLGQPSLVWVWVWKILPKNPKFFNFFPPRVKKYPGQRQLVGLLFIAGQKYAGVGSGPISTLHKWHGCGEFLIEKNTGWGYLGRVIKST